MIEFKKPIFFLILIMVVGSSGYYYIEDYSLVDSIYMTVITIATVGFSEVQHLSDTGKIFTIFLIVIGIGYAGYVISSVISFVVNGELHNIFREKKMNKLIHEMKNHIIVCGFGDVGNEACLQLVNEKRDFIIVEKNLDKLQAALKKGYLAIFGDAIDENVLNRAEISKADGIISTLSNTSENVYIALTIREMDEKITIVARGNDERSKKILYRAGVDNVVSPAQIGGIKMVSTICHNPTLDLINDLVKDRKVDIKFIEVPLKKGISIIGKTIASSNIKNETGGIMIVAIRPIDQAIILNPPAETVFSIGDKVILLGNKNQVEKFQEMNKIDSSEIKYIEKG